MMREALTATGIFRSVPSGVVSNLASRLRPVRYPSGHTIFNQGEPGVDMHILIAGNVKIMHRSTNYENIQAILAAPDIFGDLTLFDPSPRTSTAVTMTDVCTAVVDKTTLQSWIAQYPSIVFELLTVLARRLRHNEIRLADLKSIDAARRVARELLNLAQRFGTQCGKAIHVEHGLSQDELAQLVGTTRETVNKTLTELTSRGWVRTRNRGVWIMDPASLKQWAQLSQKSTPSGHSLVRREGTISSTSPNSLGNPIL